MLQNQIKINSLNYINIFNYIIYNQSNPMFQMIYTLFFWMMVLTIFFFCFLNLPTPKGWKAVVIKFLTTNVTVKNLLKLHMLLLVVACFFFFDLRSAENKFRADKLKVEAMGTAMAELKREFLSFTIFKIQRNKYITFLMVFVSAALNIYVTILQKIYDKRQKYEQEKEQKLKEAEQKEKETAA